MEQQKPKLSILIRDKISFMSMPAIGARQRILFVCAVSLSPVHNTGILERQYCTQLGGHKDHSHEHKVTREQGDFVNRHSLAAASTAGKPARENQRRSGQFGCINTGQAAHLRDPAVAGSELAGDASEACHQLPTLLSEIGELG